MMTISEGRSYRLTAYSTDMRWTGDVFIPARLRLSDILNDDRTTFLLLKHVVPATWENASLRERHEIDSIALAKHDIVAVIPSAVSQPPPSLLSAAERVSTVPFRVIVYTPPLVLVGEVNIPRNIEWVNALSASEHDFLAVTNVSIWTREERTPLHTNVKVGLVNRQKVIGVEPQS